MVSYSDGTFDCFNDVGVCCFVYWCEPCAVCEVAGKIHAHDTHGCGEVLLSLMATYCFPICSVCCCPQMIWPCFLSRLLDRSMEYHRITHHPGPCVNSRCCCCYCQMMCCSKCTLCLILREAKHLDHGHMNSIYY